MNISGKAEDPDARAGPQVMRHASDVGPSLVRAMGNIGGAVVYQGLDLRIVWSQNFPDAWSVGDTTNALDGDFLPPAVADHLAGLKKRAIDTLNSSRTEISIPFDTGARWFDIWIDADTGPGGKARGVVTTAIETTDRKRREQTLRALLREVSHRSKNLLSIIQSIATQTGRYSGTIDNFMVRFRGRLQSMASSQDLVTSSNWRGADLRELVVGQVARYSQDPNASIRFEGETPWLSPNAALHIGLALHELAVNSVSYGALSRPGGFITVSADLVERDNGSVFLALCWSELVGMPELDQALRSKSFASATLERIVPTSLDGSATLEFVDGQLEYKLVIPHGQFEID